MLGRAGDEFVCSHEHRAGDECLAIMLEPALVETLPLATWRHGALPPLSELMVLGQLAEASASGATEVGLDEASVLLMARTMTLSADQPPAPVRVRARDRRRMIEAALWIEDRCHETLGLEQAARSVDLSPYHFLRQFRAVLGVTPHQYLLRCRLRRAAYLLAESDLPVTDVALDVGFRDLSNFIRTFRGAAGVAPRDFRRGAVRASASTWPDGRHLRHRQRSAAHVKIARCSPRDPTLKAPSSGRCPSRKLARLSGCTGKSFQAGKRGGLGGPFTR